MLLTTWRAERACPRAPPGGEPRPGAERSAQDGTAPFETLTRELQREFRTFRLIPKQRSPLMWLLYHALLMRWWCPDFIDGYTTVIITQVYMPQQIIGTDSGYRSLRHERVHMRDCVRSGVLPFALSYLFLLPAGLTLRSVWEMRGYAETMRVELEQTSRVSDALLQHIQRQFTGPAYLYMCPFPALVRRWLERTRRRVLATPVSPLHGEPLV